MLFKHVLVSGVAIFGLLGGCGSPQTVEPIQRASLPKVQRPVSPAISPAAYVASAGSIDLYVIKASELALQRSTALRVREVATRLIDAHRGSSAQLSFGGRRLNLLPSAILAPKYQALLEQLSASADFDRDYARHMRIVHQEAVALHANYATAGTSPTLVPIAKVLAPIMERQVRLISYL